MSICLRRQVLQLSKHVRTYGDKKASGRTGSARKGLVLGAYVSKDGKDLKLTKAAEKFNGRVNGKMVEMLKDAGNMKQGKCHVFNNIDPEYWAVAIVGIGPQNIGYDEHESFFEGQEDVRVAASVGATRLRKEGIYNIYIDEMGYAEAAAEGSTLACWRFQENMLKSNWKMVPNLELYDSTDTENWTRGVFKADAQNLARRLCDMPANQLTPTSFAQAAVDALCPAGVNVDVRDKEWIEDQDMNTFLTVAKGSCEPPVFLELTYCGGDPDQKPIALIGTGITFDSGGMNLKKPKNMDKHRAAMAGGAVVVAAIRAAATLCLPINITGLIPLCENLPSGLSMKPGDVVTALNGKTIVIHDTDNEGHLILADTFVYAAKAHRPKMVVDISTLTSCIRAALGAGASGVFSNSRTLWKTMQKAGAVTGDRVWRMPLWEFYTKELVKEKQVDITNKGYHYGDACVGAAFLNEFIAPYNLDWLHMDITGVGMLTKTPNTPYLRIGRMTGRPTRTIIQFLTLLACKDKDKKK